MDCNHREEKFKVNTWYDSIQTETSNERNTDCDSDHRDKDYALASKSKSIFIPTLTANPGRIDEDIRKRLKSVLNSCLVEGKKNNVTDNDHDINRIVQNIDSRRIKTLNKTKHASHSQCIAVINKPDPGIHLSHGELSTVDQSFTLSHNDHKASQASSNNTTISSIGINHQSSRERQNQNDDFHAIGIKQESSDNNQVDDLNNFKYSDAQKETNEITEDKQSNHKSFETPKKSESLMTGKNTPTVSVKRFRRSIMKIEITNHKITEYFPKTSNYRTPTAHKSKRENVDLSFILSALEGDPNYCVVCEKNLKCSYIKKHLVEQHGIDKESIRGRPIKKENASEELTDKL